MKKALLLALLLYPAPAIPAAPRKPKLILAVVVDQFRYDYLIRFRADYRAGLARLLDHGAVFTNAHHVSFPTVTAIGHSTFLSGATPSVSGIAGNEWYDRATKRQVTSVSDDGTELLGGGHGEEGSSPRKLLVSTLGDEIKMQHAESKTIGVSIKDRSAILPAGRMADGAYWYDSASNHWVTSTYYVKELPAWVSQVNLEQPNRKFTGQSWKALDAKAGEPPFCTMVAGGDVPFCGSVEQTPWGNELIEEFAERALVNEGLGKHQATDILAVSFSSNDYVGHKVGPDAPEVRDISIRTDRLLGKLMDLAERQVGVGNLLVVLTADHGVAPVPEVNEARRMPGGRLSMAALVKPAQKALRDKYGEGKWIEAQTAGALYLNLELIAMRRLNLAEVEETAAAGMRQAPHAYRVYTGEQISKGLVLDDFVSAAVRNGYFPQRSADVIFLAEPYYMFSEEGTTHGTPFAYDTQVPIIFMGPGIKPGLRYERVGVTDIAPTLAAIVQVSMPSGTVGRILSQIFE